MAIVVTGQLSRGRRALTDERATVIREPMLGATGETSRPMPPKFGKTAP